MPDHDEIRLRRADLLGVLLWSATRLLHPTLRNLTMSYEGWCHLTGFSRHLARLEKRHWIESRKTPSGGRIYRLTEAGRLQALGGRDPVSCWDQKWDGRWHMVVFDVPVSRDEERDRLRRSLRKLGFGLLQQSAWISPRSIHGPEMGDDPEGSPDVSGLSVWECRQIGRGSVSAIVSAAWDFDRINDAYRRHLKILEHRPLSDPANPATVGAMIRWGRAEQIAWLGAVRIDPLLTAELIPPGYLGRTAWQRRVEVLGHAGQQPGDIQRPKS